MWPFGHTKDVSHAPMQEPELTPALRRRLDDLDSRVHLQEKGLKALEMDWQEWFDKFRLMYARLSKRIKDATESTQQDAPGTTNGQPVAHDDPPNRQLIPRVRRNY